MYIFVIRNMKIMFKRFLAFLFLLFLCACDTELILPVVDQVLENEISVSQSRYTGRLIPVGSVENFGVSITVPIAIEWNGESLYMIASYGRYPNHGIGLFTVDRSTGVAAGGGRLGGFARGQNFTQTLNFSPRDMVWVSETETMLAVCGVLDSILRINLETGRAERLTFERDFCLRTDDGYPVIGAGTGLGFDGETLYMTSVSRGSQPPREGETEPWYRHVSEFYSIDSSYRCATFIGSVGSADLERIEATALCFDGQFMYMAGEQSSFSIIDRETGFVHLIAEWSFVSLPEGYAVHELGILNIEENAVSRVDVTGLAYDGENMYAVESFTDALYLLERVE